MSRLRPLRPVGAPLATTAELSALVSELSRAKRVTVLSGAGISTESGLSDYRSPGRPGPRRPPISHHEFVGDAAVRARYWTRSFVGFPALSGTRPNPTHLALAALHEQDARWAKHVTQNVDGLLFAAGMKDDALVELHGSVHWLKCGECNGLESREHFQGRLAELNGQWATQLSQVQFRPDGDAELDDALVDGFVVPSCAKCDAENLMPGVVFHGGQVCLAFSHNAPVGFFSLRSFACTSPLVTDCSPSIVILCLGTFGNYSSRPATRG